MLLEHPPAFRSRAPGGPLTLPDLSQRDLGPELMDDPGLDPGKHRAALDGLARVHRVTGTVRVLWREIGPLAREAAERSGGRGFTLLDIASGGGDLLLTLERRARRAGLDPRCEGADLSPLALERARGLAVARGSAVSFRHLDALQGALPERDVLVSTLFLHHLTGEAARDLLARMARAARRGIVVHDLERTRLGHALAWAGTRILTRSPVVQCDGPRSVRNAFAVGEARVLAECAGLAGARVRRDFPGRWTLTWRNPSPPP